MAPFLLTGGHGFIGSYVTRLLHSQGRPVRLLLRPGSRTDRLEGIPFEPIPGDMRDLESLRSATQGCAGVIHLAGLSKWSEIQSPALQDVVVDGTLRLLQAAREAGVRTLVVSSLAALGGTSSPQVLDEDSPFTLQGPRSFAYAFAKREAEGLCQQAHQRGQEVVVVNPAEVYGPQDTEKVTCGTLLDFARSYPVLVTRGGTCVTYVEDVAAGILAAFERGRSGQRYILGGDNLSIRELARLTLEILEQPKPLVTMPGPLLLALAWVGSTFGVNVSFEPGVAPYALRYWWADNRKAREELGLSFRGARATLEPTLTWMRDIGWIG